jgi:uncharacterized spore protein YtfJ
MIMKETPVNKIMENTLEKMRQMVDTSTIIGEPMVTGTTTLIPVSKVSYGFTSGGTDLPSKQNQELFGVQPRQSARRRQLRRHYD